MAARAKVAVKRVYEKASQADGTRVLVDRLWPRGLTKAEAKLDLWLRDLAPSNELRKWFHIHPGQWGEFRQRYLKELQKEPAAEALRQLQKILSEQLRVTLLFASKDTERNNATVLKDFIEGRKKPASITQSAVRNRKPA
jgi:uncharacterized protein YeaO (DUF488 family)